MTPEQQQALDRIVDVYRQAAPAGWLRIVCRWECELDEDGDADAAMAHVVIVESDGEITQVQITQPDEAYFLTEDFYEELARETESGELCIDLIIDRDSHDITLTEEPSKMLEGDFDDSSRRVHHYLENNRAELEALAART